MHQIMQEAPGCGEPYKSLLRAPPTDDANHFHLAAGFNLAAGNGSQLLSALSLHVG